MGCAGVVLTVNDMPKGGRMERNVMAGLLFALMVLMAGCGGGASSTGSGSNAGTAKGTPPSANAGADQNVNVGAVVTLDGSGSDGNGKAISYIWSFTSKPSGSHASLSDSTIVKPTLIPDVAGTYSLNLIVNDGVQYSTPAKVDIVAFQLATNVAPVADAGVPQNVLVGSTVTMNASNSRDSNGDVLSYSWSFTSRPNGSITSLTNPTAVNTTFVPDIVGTYTLSLVVNDGTTASIPSIVNIVAFPLSTDIAPVADAGVPQTVLVGSTVNLDGSNSMDANNDVLSYSWSFVSTPSNSIATLTNATSVNPAFIPDVPGAYVVELVVHGGTVESVPDTVTIAATVADPFERNWHGTWTVGGEVGTLNFALSNGIVSGSVSNATLNRTSSFGGTYDGTGSFNARYEYADYCEQLANACVISGNIQVTNENQLVVNAMNSFNSKNEAFITVLTAN